MTSNTNKKILKIPKWDFPIFFCYNSEFLYRYRIKKQDLQAALIAFKEPAQFSQFHECLSPH